MSKQLRAGLLLTLTALIWGAAFVAQSVGMDYVGPFTYLFSRSVIGGIVLLPLIKFSSKKEAQTKPRDVKTLIIGGICCGIALFVASSFQQIGIKYTTVGKAGFITSLYMIIVPIIAGFIFNLFYFNEKSTRSKLVQMGSFFSIILVTNLILHFSSEENTLSDSLYSLLMATTWFYLAPMIVAIILRHMKSISYSTISSALAFIAMMGIVINTVIITASGQESLRQVGLLLILSCFLHNIIGYTVGYTAAKLAKLPEKDRRTIAFEVGMQNGGVATGLALAMGKVATVGLASAIFGPLQNLTGSALVNIFKKRPVKE